MMYDVENVLQYQYSFTLTVRLVEQEIRSVERISAQCCFHSIPCTMFHDIKQQVATYGITPLTI